MKLFTSFLCLISFCQPAVLFSQQSSRFTAIYSGITWFDDHQNLLSARGACIVAEAGKFYLFGEKHVDTSSAFAGFTCYSSPDLYNWKMESAPLPVQVSGKLDPKRVGERVKVIKRPAIWEYGLPGIPGYI